MPLFEHGLQRQLDVCEQSLRIAWTRSTTLRNAAQALLSAIANDGSTLEVTARTEIDAVRSALSAFDAQVIITSKGDKDEHNP